MKKIFENSDAENNRFVQEYIGNVLCKNLNINGLLCYTGEPKRGIYHYDSYVFPIIATAITKGKWNVSEYKKELEPLLVEFNIDTSKRGCL